jgi:hypothetical protein
MVRAGVNERVAMKTSGYKTQSVFESDNIVCEDNLREAGRRTWEHGPEGDERKGYQKSIPWCPEAGLEPARTLPGPRDFKKRGYCFPETTTNNKKTISGENNKDLVRVK